MADLDVEKKKNNDWWKWLLGILAAIAIIWIIVESTGDEDVDNIDDTREIQNDTTVSSEEVLPVAKYSIYSSNA